MKSNEEIEKILTDAFGSGGGVSVNYDENEKTWEVIFNDTDENGECWMDVTTLGRLNMQGLVYAGEQTGIDYEDGEEDNLETYYMDIFYFKHIEITNINQN